MILLSPPLPVISGSLSGFMVGISPQLVRMTWVDTGQQTHRDQWQRPGMESTVTVSVDEHIHFQLSIMHSKDDDYQINPTSTAQLTELLHLVRKSQHINICRQQDVEHSHQKNGFDQVVLPVISLPEKSFAELVTQRSFLGQIHQAPILITGMTGGVTQATTINERLATAATHYGIPMGIGSQRMALENNQYASIFQLKRKFPKLFLIGNIGIGQLQHDDAVELCQRAVDMIEANALAIHVNVLQELIQVEGDRDFRGLLDKISKIQNEVSVPVIVKEVGAGLDVATAQALFERGIKAFDVGGGGGTSWAHIEGLRASDPMVQRRGAIFRDWGIPTALALQNLRSALPNAEIVATGGIRDGLTVLKATNLGATMAGIGLPLMRAAVENEDRVVDLLGSIVMELKIAMMCSGIALS